MAFSQPPPPEKKKKKKNTTIQQCVGYVSVFLTTKKHDYKGETLPTIPIESPCFNPQ